MLKQKGFTLLEVLVALLVVGIGVLGHAKMQAKSMDTAQRARYTQTANSALIDLAQRMRANSEVASYFVYDNLTSGDEITASVDCANYECSDAQFAEYELAEWFNHQQSYLPSPRFSVVKSDQLYTLTLIWDAAKTGSGSSSCDLTDANSYQCGSVEIWIP